MDQALKENVRQSVAAFSLPLFDEIPDVGLYLEQTAKYISEYLSCLGDFALTGSMVSNYVKRGLIANPYKKQYNREQIAYLFFIAIAKSVLGIDDLRLFISLQKSTYTAQRAYSYFKSEMESILKYVFGLSDAQELAGVDDTDEKALLRNTIITVAHKIYLDKYCAALHQAETREVP